MATYTRAVWGQIKGVTLQKLQRAMQRDGWVLETNKGREGKKGANTLAYRHPDRPAEKNRIVLHPHPKKTFSPNLLKFLLDELEWDEDDLRRLKLVK